MWPFRRRLRAEEVDLRGLTLITDPVVHYVNLLLCSMSEQSQSVFTLRADAPLPPLSPRYGPWAEPMPTYEDVAQRLRHLAGMEQTGEQPTKSGRIELVSGTVGAVTFHVEVSEDEETMTLRVERLGRSVP